MDYTDKVEIQQCRTCYNATKILKPLTNLTKCGDRGEQQRKSFAQLLNEISSINVMDDLNNGLPQYICDVCIRKLRMAYAFVQQAQDVNERLIKIVRKQKKAYKRQDYLREAEIRMDPLVSQHVLEELSIEIKEEVMEVDGSTDIFEQSEDVEVDVGGPAPAKMSKKDIKNEDILDILKGLTTRLIKIEQNQSVLSQSQTTFVASQQEIAHKLEQIEANIVSKKKMMSPTEITECKMAARDIHEPGEKGARQLDEVAGFFPLKTVPEVLEVEQRLENPDFSQAMTIYLNKVKGISEDVGSVIRSIMTDELLETYNWEGRWEKNSLGKLLLFNSILRNVFPKQVNLDFERSIRKAVERGHHRVKQKKYCNKNK